MKKIGSLLMALCVCLFIGVTFTACNLPFLPLLSSHSHAYATEWSHNATHHWHACTGEGCTDVSDKAEHTWNAGEITPPATADANATKTFTCTTCGATKTESAPFVTTVTEEEWLTNMLIDNFTLTYLSYGEFTQADSLPIIKSTATKGLKQSKIGEGTQYYYSAFIDGVWYSISNDTGNYIAIPFKNTASINVELSAGILLTNDPVKLAEIFAKATYDATERAYFVNEVNGDNNLGVYFYFENGQLVKIKLTDYSIDQMITVTDIGTTVIDLPEFILHAEHTWSDGHIVSPATPEADGIMGYFCAVCGSEKTEPYSYVPEEVTYTVTKEQWVENMSCTNFTFEALVRMTDGSSIYTWLVGNTETAIIMEQTYGDTPTVTMYVSLVDGIWYTIYDAGNGYIGLPMEDIADDEYNSLGASITGYSTSEVCAWYDEFVYDEEEQAYYISLTQDGEVIDIYFYFKNGVFYKYVFESSHIGEAAYKIEVGNVFDLGTTEIEVPEFTVQE